MKKIANLILWLILLYLIWNIVIVPLWGLMVYLNWASNGGLFTFIAGIIIIGIVLAWCSK